MARTPTPYDLDINKSDIHKEYMNFAFDQHDPWGSHQDALYCVCQCMVLRNMPVPEEFGFAPNYDDCTDVKDDWYLYELTTTMTDDDLLVFANDLNAAENQARIDGMSY